MQPAAAMQPANMYMPAQMGHMQASAPTPQLVQPPVSSPAPQPGAAVLPQPGMFASPAVSDATVAALPPLPDGSAVGQQAEQGSEAPYDRAEYRVAVADALARARQMPRR